MISPRVSLLLGLPLAAALLFGLEAFSAGEPPALWVAQSRGIAKVVDGAVAFEIPSAAAVEALAVDGKHKRVWAYAGRQLLSYDYDGHPLTATTLDAPNGNPALLAVDARAGRVWLALHAQLMLFDGQGRGLRQMRLPVPVAGMTVDARRSQLWAAYKGVLQVYDAAGERLAELSRPDLDQIHALDYDARLDQVWVAADDGVRRFAPNGAQAFSAPLEWLSRPTAIAADQDSGLWATDSRQVLHLNSAGGVDFAVAPPLEALGPFVVSLVVDARDHSAWVATQRRVAHYGAGGAQLADFPLHEGDPSRLVRQLALPAGPVAPQVEIVSPISGSTLNTSLPAFTLRYSGENLDLDSIVLDADAAPLRTSCIAGDASATCIVLDALADGTYDVTATIADAAGNVSEPALVRITLDTVAPVITLTSPPDGLLTNVGSVHLEGELSEAAALAVNGAPVAVAEQRFSHPMTLVEGRNDFALRATDAAGNVGARDAFAVLDTVPPPAPVTRSITARAAAGQVTVAGSAGSVEGGSLVTLVNARTGERVTVMADADGSFSATLVGEAGDTIGIHATDGATNQGPGASVTAAGGPFSGAITFGPSVPANGATVDGDRVLVAVNLSAPPNTGVTVNDVVAAGVPTVEGMDFYAEVPLKTGANTLTIKAHGQDGRVVARTINVTSRGPFPYRIVADRSVGVAPLKPRLEVWDQSGRGIRQVQVDADANGFVDFVANPGDPIELNYTGSGVRQARVFVVDNAGQSHFQRLTFVLLNLAAVDRDIQAVWGAMNQALSSGDKMMALSFLSDQARETYEPVFEALMPRMGEIVGSYSALHRAFVVSDYAEYGVNRTISGVERVFLMGAVTNANGQWQVDSM